MPDFEQWSEWWDDLAGVTLLEQELWRLVVFAALILAGLVVGRLSRWLLERLSKRQTEAGQLVLGACSAAFARSATLLGFAFSLAPAFASLYLPDEGVRGFTVTLADLLMTIAVGFTIYQLVDVPDRWLVALGQRNQSKMHDMIAPIVSKTLRAVVILLSLVQVATVLSNKPVTSIIAGLGIGGLAIGLAAQDSIKNFFGSLSLLADKPFEMGDRVKVGDIDGMIESVGLRSTRIRTLIGHLVTIPNGDLANRTIENIARRPFLFRKMNITVTYDTPPEKVQRAIVILQEILAGHPGQNAERPPRVYFNEFNDVSLNILVLFWYFPADWWAFNDLCQKVNFEILQRFNAEGIEFAFPTQTLYLAGDPNRPLEIGQRQAEKN